MASSDLISRLGAGTMPLRAILQHDLRNLYESRMVRLWLAAAALLTAAIVLSNWSETPSAPLAAMLLFPFLVFPWFPVNLVLHTFSLEQYSPITLNQTLPVLLRQPWRAEAEAETAQGEDMEALARQAAHFLGMLSGAPPQPAREPGFFDRAAVDDFSLLRVVLGYGVPTLVSIGLAAACFHIRDF